MHCFRKLAGRADDVGGDDAVLDDLLVVVDVVDEQVQRADPLLEAPLDPVPFGGRHDPGDEIEGKDPLGAGAVAVHVERDPHVQERALGRLLPAQQLAVRHRLDQLDQRPGGRLEARSRPRTSRRRRGRSDSARISWRRPMVCAGVREFQEQVCAQPDTLRATFQRGNAFFDPRCGSILSLVSTKPTILSFNGRSGTGPTAGAHVERASSIRGRAGTCAVSYSNARAGLRYVIDSTNTESPNSCDR